MRRVLFFIASTLALLGTPVLAGEPDKTQAPDKPLADRDVGAKEVVETPATDLNIKKEPIPMLLVAAEQRPYRLSGIGTCQQIAAAIREFDTVLGDDLDLPQTDNRRMTPGRVAQSVVGAFIPFRGVIREASGANQHDRDMQAAVLAGVARRSFLKGIGQGKGCRYPARSATLDISNRRLPALDTKRETRKTGAADAAARSADSPAQSQSTVR
jgi:hypothetical protein